MLPQGLDQPVSQETFGMLVGVSQQRVAALVAEGVLQRDGTCLQWLRGYCERLREQAAGRGQELTIERAALAREQRRGQFLKNQITERKYAPVGLLADVLAEASAAVASRFDALAGELRTACPQLDDRGREHVLGVIAAARNAWVKGTASMTLPSLEEAVDDSEGETPGDADDDGIADDEAQQ